MKTTVEQYLQNYQEIKSTNKNSMGMIAEFGEQTIKDINDPKTKREYKQKYSSYGIGKTHLQAAVANYLLFTLKQTVLFVRDVEIMQKLQGCKYNDPIRYQNLIEDMTRRDVLIWDDLGKSKASDAKQDIYYEVINQRYVNRKPILFSSNEDEDTLGDRVGYAALDRLIGMSGKYLLLLKGESYRRL